MSSLLRALTCPITHELFEDPVNAADGNTYSRAALARYAHGKHRENRKPLFQVPSPVNPAVTLGDLRKLAPNRKVAELVELAVKLCPDDELAQEWNAKKRKRELEEAEVMWRAGRVEEAAARGHEGAVAELRRGKVAAEADGLLEEAKVVLLADKGDPTYRRLLRQAAALDCQAAILLLGKAYAEGLGGEARPEKAIECFMRSQAVKSLV